MNSLKIKLVLVATLVMFCGSAFAQNANLGPEWGENATQEQRHENALRFNYYRDAYNSKRYDDAMKYLPALIENSPKGAQNIYVYATNIYKNKIQRSTDLAERNGLVDSLMGLYDLRVKNFGDNVKYGTPYILKQKAIDYVGLKSSDRDMVQKYFVDAIKANENDPDIDLINLYFNELTTDFKNDYIDVAYYMGQYEWLSGYVAKVTDPALAEAKSTFDGLLVSSGAASCENIEKIFKSRIEANPNDVASIAKAFAMLASSKCNTPFLAEVGEMYFKAEPTASTARILSNVYLNNGDSAKALKFLKAAFDNEKNATDKSLLGTEISGMELSLSNASAAAQYANQARQLNPNNGYAYILLANAYVSGSSACSGFDRQTVYWLAYDVLASGRKLFSESSPEIKQIDNMMSMCRSSFPSNDELFFRGLSAGGSYDVKCGWISGRTTVK